MDEILQLLGEDLFKQVKEKLGEKSLIMNDGSYIPKSRFDEANNQAKDLKAQLADRDKQLAELSKQAKGHEDLQKQIDELQAKNKTAAEEYEARIQAQALDHALERELMQAKAKNPKAVRALLDMEKVKLNGDKLDGLDDQLKGLQEKESYLFDVEESPGLGGRTPHGGGGATPPKVKFTQEQVSKMTQAEIATNYEAIMESRKNW